MGGKESRGDGESEQQRAESRVPRAEFLEVNWSNGRVVDLTRQSAESRAHSAKSRGQEAAGSGLVSLSNSREVNWSSSRLGGARRKGQSAWREE